MENDQTETGPIAPEVVTRMLATAREFAERAYVPYSRFPVGAAVLTADGGIIGGVNIENASYGLTVCGERVALFTAAAAGHREVRAVAVSAPKAAGTTPCGACRQILWEFGGDLEVILANLRRETGRHALSELLPLPFDQRLLK